MSGHVEHLRQRLSSLVVEPVPAPWTEVGSLSVGGLLVVGVHRGREGRESVLVVSHDGRGVFDAQTGERVGRDRQPLDGSWLVESELRAMGIGPAEGEWVSVAGIWGGGLPTMTSDKWSVEVLTPNWPEELVVLAPPGGSVWIESHASKCRLIDKPIDDVRAVGFSWSGRTLIEATSSGLRLWGRDSTAEVSATI